MVGYFLVVFIFFSGVVWRGNFSLTFWCTSSSFKSLILQIIAKLLNDTSYYMNRFQCLEGYRPRYVFLSLQIESVINFHTVFYKVRKFSENCYMAQPSSNFRFKKRVWHVFKIGVWKITNGKILILRRANSRSNGKIAWHLRCFLGIKATSDTQHR